MVVDPGWSGWRSHGGAKGSDAPSHAARTGCSALPDGPSVMATWGARYPALSLGDLGSRRPSISMLIPVAVMAVALAVG